MRNITFDTKEDKKEDLVDEQTLQLRKMLKTPLEDLRSFGTCIQLPESC
jgi:hypothetical protein